MPPREIKTSSAPSPIGAFSQALVVDQLVFVSGQGPIDPKTGEVVGSTIEAQTEQTLRNLEAILSAAGAGLGDVVSCRGYLADLDDFPGYDATYSRFFYEPRPVRTTIGAELLGIMVEIDVVARLPESRPA
jgi:2-iminobutanoate/2-iminopropanoate deaminase